MADPLLFRCAFCARKLLGRDDIPRHEAHCDEKDARILLWDLLLRLAKSRERRNGT